LISSSLIISTIGLVVINASQ